MKSLKAFRLLLGLLMLSSYSTVAYGSWFDPIRKFFRMLPHHSETPAPIFRESEQIILKKSPNFVPHAMSVNPEIYGPSRFNSEDLMQQGFRLAPRVYDSTKRDVCNFLSRIPKDTEIDISPNTESVFYQNCNDEVCVPLTSNVSPRKIVRFSGAVTMKDGSCLVAWNTPLDIQNYYVNSAEFSIGVLSISRVLDNSFR